MPARKLQEQVNKFAENIDHIRSTAEILDAVMAMISPLGYTAAASGRFGHADLTDILHFQNWTKEALEVYAREERVRIDPATIWAKQSGTAATVSEIRATFGKDHPG
ncbi:MAG: autoinducer binding domain-containing protein [Xanthobacteraceae bacterium]